MKTQKMTREKVNGQKGIFKTSWVDKHGVLKVRFGFTVMVNGSRVSKDTFDTVEQAVASRFAKIKELQESNGNGDTLTFDSLIDKHIAHGVEHDFRVESFVTDYERMKNYFDESVLSKRAVDVSKQDILNALDNVNGNGAGKKRIHAQVKAVFNTNAIKLNYNPVKDIPTPNVKTEKKSTEKNGVKYCPPKCDLDKVFELMTQEQRDFYEAMFICGARAGTQSSGSGFASLTWSDVDFDNGLLYIHNFKNGGSKASNVKSVEIMLTVKLQEIMQRRLSAKSDETDLVFYKIDQRTGKPRKWQSNDDTHKNGLKDMCEQANIKPFSAGAIRNARAGYLFDKGVDVRIIQDILGHERIQQTFDYINSLGKAINAGSKLSALEL